jgi:hypothetical protein
MVAFVIATVGCTEPDGHGGPPSRATDVAPTSVSSLASLPDEMTSALDGFTGQLVITRQRDLIDRGLINVLTMNGTADDVYITDRALVADFFENSAAPVRRSWVPPGRSVALQVPYGTTIDCTTNEPVRAHLRITYTLGDDEREQTADIALEGADILDAIRAEQCAQRTFDAATRLGFEDVAVVDQVLVATLTIARTSGESSFVIEGANGTILIGGRDRRWLPTRPDRWSDGRRTSGDLRREPLRPPRTGRGHQALRTGPVRRRRWPTGTGHQRRRDGPDPSAGRDRRTVPPTESMTVWCTGKNRTDRTQMRVRSVQDVSRHHNVGQLEPPIPP